MKNWYFWFTRQWIKYFSLFDHFIEWTARKEGLSAKDNKAFEEGKTFTEKAAAEQHVQEHIASTFDNLKVTINAAVKEGKRKLETKREGIQQQIDLVSSTGDDHMDRLENEEADLRKGFVEAEKLFHPEKQWQQFMAQNEQECRRNLQGMLDKPESELEIMKRANRQNILFGFIKREVKKFRELLHLCRSEVYSSRFPPSKSTYRATLAGSIVMIGCEMFLSRKILLGIAAEAQFKIIGHLKLSNYINELAILIYAAGVSYLLSRLFRSAFGVPPTKIKVGENKISVNPFIVGLCFIAIASLMSFFFSMEGSAQSFTITPKGFLFGILSAGLAFANALLYRQSKYQKDLFKKLYPVRTIKAVMRAKTAKEKQFTRRLARLSRKLSKYESKLSPYEAVNPEIVERYINNLRAVYTQQFWNGFDSKLNEMIDNNREFKFLNRRLVKNKLFHEERKNADISSGDGSAAA